MLGIDEIISGGHNNVEDYYKVLGCNETSTEEQISTEFRLLALKYHPDKNPNNRDALMKFNKLKEARDVLVDPERRADYDKWKRSEISISFRRWQNLGSRCHTTMHWAKPKEQTMLEDSVQHAGSSTLRENPIKQPEQISDVRSSCKSFWKSENNDVYGQFRRYEI